MPKRSSRCRGEWAILPQFCTNFRNFACRVHIIISTQMKCKTYGIFKSFFKRKSPLLYPTSILSLRLSAYCRCQSTYLICLMFFDFKSDMTRLCNVQTTVGQSRSVFVANQIF